MTTIRNNGILYWILSSEGTLVEKVVKSEICSGLISSIIPRFINFSNFSMLMEDTSMKAGQRVCKKLY